MTCSRIGCWRATEDDELVPAYMFSVYLIVTRVAKFPKFESFAGTVSVGVVSYSRRSTVVICDVVNTNGMMGGVTIYYLILVVLSTQY